MKKIGLSSLIAGLLMANIAGADPVDVKDGAAFIAGNNLLSVIPATSAGLPDTCVLDTSPESIPNATDVVVSHGNAFVTSTDPATGAVAVKTVDVRSCLVPSSANSCDDVPRVNLAAGVVFIPCLEANGQSFDITMRQRGNSMNWEVTGFEDSVHRSSGNNNDD
jgi:hypothetical protein